MPERLEGRDRQYGWKFGCDGFVNATKAAKILGIHPGYACELLRELESLTIKRPSDRTWPLRAGRPDVATKLNEWMVCLRSVHEYAKRRQPVEV